MQLENSPILSRIWRRMDSDWIKKSLLFGSYSCCSVSRHSIARIFCIGISNLLTSSLPKITVWKSEISVSLKCWKDRQPSLASVLPFIFHLKSATTSPMDWVLTCGHLAASSTKCAHLEYFFNHLVSLRSFQYDSPCQENRDGWCSSAPGSLFSRIKWYRHVWNVSLRKMFVKDSKKRITSDQILKTPYIMRAIADFIKEQGRLEQLAIPINNTESTASTN